MGGLRKQVWGFLGKMQDNSWNEELHWLQQQISGLHTDITVDETGSYALDYVFTQGDKNVLTDCGKILTSSLKYSKFKEMRNNVLMSVNHRHYRDLMA